MAYDIELWVEGEIADRRYRWVRWTATLGLVALAVATVTEIAAGDHEPDGLLFGISLIGGLFGFLTLLFSPFSRMLWRPGRAIRFDEREQALMGQVNARAFRIVGVTVLLALGCCWLASNRGWWLPRTGAEWQALLRFAALTFAALPTIIAEWSVPPLPGGVED